MTNIIAVNPIDCNAIDPSVSMPGQGVHSFVAPSLAAAMIAHHRGMVSSCRHHIVAKRNDCETLCSQRARRDEEFAYWFPFMSTHYWLPTGCRMSPNLAAYFSASLINRVRCTPFVRFVATLVSWAIAIWAPLVVCPILTTSSRSNLAHSVASTTRKPPTTRR